MSWVQFQAMLDAELRRGTDYLCQLAVKVKAGDALLPGELAFHLNALRGHFETLRRTVAGVKGVPQ